MLWKVACSVLLVGVVYPLCAEAQEPAWLAVTNGYYRHAADCWDRFDHGKIKTFPAAVHCADDGLRERLEATQYPDIDLANWMLDQHARISKAVENRKISVATGRKFLTDVEERLRVAFDERRAAQRAELARKEAEYAELKAQVDAEERANALADAEQRAATLGFAAGMLAPTRSGTFGESVGNGLNGYSGQAPPRYGLPPVVNVAPSQTTCYWAGPQLICNTQ